jgi:peptide/nickel transport system substrate-binding protein
MISGLSLRRITTISAAAVLATAISFPVQAQKKTRVAVGVTETVGAYNPHSDSVALMYAVWCQVYGCLGSWNFQKAADVGMLAESWTIPEPNTWVFKLKKGLRRHDNKAELTAADVVHSIKRIGTDKRSSQRQNVKKIKSAVALDKYTVQLKTFKPTAPLLQGCSALLI